MSLIQSFKDFLRPVTRVTKTTYINDRPHVCGPELCGICQHIEGTFKKFAEVMTELEATIDAICKQGKKK